MQKDVSLFASKDDQISHINIAIKDGLTEIQFESEEIKQASQEMPRGTTPSHKKAIQAGIDTLTGRMVGIGVDFKNFLQDHQKQRKKQEAKKSKLIGGVASAPTTDASGAVRNNSSTNSSMRAKRKMHILPHHASQQATRAAGKGISGAAVFNDGSGEFDDT